MSYPLTQSTGSIICGAGWVKRLIYYVKKFFGLIVLDLCINVHSCFAVFMSGKVLNRLGVNACIKQICNIGMPLRYNYDKPEKPRISRVFGYLARFFILFQTEKSSREVIIS